MHSWRKVCGVLCKEACRCTRGLTCRDGEGHGLVVLMEKSVSKRGSSSCEVSFALKAWNILRGSSCKYVNLRGRSVHDRLMFVFFSQNGGVFEVGAALGFGSHVVV